MRGIADIVAVSITERIVEFALGVEAEELPAEVSRVAKHSLADCLGVTVAGAGTDVGKAISRYVISNGGAPSARVIGDPTMVPPGASALANGTMAHALDLDDDEPFFLVGHPSAPILSALIGLAHEVRPTGPEVLAAFVAGTEVEMAVGRILNPQHYDAGWHATSSIGVLGAAMACARLLRLEPEQASAALGIAASTSSGLKRNFGTMTKPLHVGRASEAAVLAATLADDGFSAATEVLDGPFGLLDVFGGEPETALGEFERLGESYGLSDPGVAIKRFPSCSNTHPAIDAIIELRDEGALAAGVSSIVCHVAPGTERILQYEVPTNGLEGKFSMPYCLAVAAVHGPPWIEHFTDAAIDDPAVRDVMSAVTMVFDPRMRTSDVGVSTSASVLVTDALGAVHERTVLSPVGSAKRPLSEEQVRAKFHACCEPYLPLAGDAAFQRLAALEEEIDFAGVLDEIAIGFVTSERKES